MTMATVLSALLGSGRRLASNSAPQTAEPPPAVAELTEKTEQQAKAVQSALSRLEIRTSKRREAARCQVLGALLVQLTTLSRLLRRDWSTPDQRLLGSLKQSLEQLDDLISSAEGKPEKEGFFRHAYRETAWALVLKVQCIVLELGDTSYVLACLQEEQLLDQDSEAENRWSARFESSKLYELVTALSSDGDIPAKAQREAIEMLARLYSARSEADREYRTQETLRVVRVRWVSRFLIGALVALAVLYGLIILPDTQSLSDRWLDAMLVAITLASTILGGMLGSIRKLQEEPLVSRSGELPRYRWAFIAQILVSGALGLLVLAVATLTILPAFGLTPDNTQVDWRDSQNLTLLSLYAFLAGFSEAFAFDNLQRWVSGGAV